MSTASLHPIPSDLTRRASELVRVADLPALAASPPDGGTLPATAAMPSAVSQEPALLRFQRLQKNYGQLQALAGIDLEVRQGRILALLGPNGAGKSTLFGCLLGLVRPTAGSIQFADRPIVHADRFRFGYVAERIALYPQRTVLENGVFFAKLRGQERAEFRCQLRRVGLDQVEQRPVRQLSKGMLQRLGLAIALCGQPELLVLDEPFNGLDPALLDVLHQILIEENKRGATLLIATHTISAVERLANEVAILLEGRLVLRRSLAELREQFSGAGLESVYHHVARQAQGEPFRELNP